MTPLKVDPKETWEQMVQRIAAERHAPVPTDEEAGFVLWNFTAFPFTKAERIAEQLDRFFASVTPLLEGTK